MEPNPEDSVTEESVPEAVAPQGPQPIHIQVPDEAIINELRGELEQANHDKRLMKLALGQAHTEIAVMRQQFEGLMKTVAGQSKKSKTKVQQEPKPRKKAKKK